MLAHGKSSGKASGNKQAKASAAPQAPSGKVKVSKR
jgi:hypothetical protein